MQLYLIQAKSVRGLAETLIFILKYPMHGAITICTVYLETLVISRPIKTKFCKLLAPTASTMQGFFPCRRPCCVHRYRNKYQYK